MAPKILTVEDTVHRVSQDTEHLPSLWPHRANTTLPSLHLRNSLRRAIKSLLEISGERLEARSHLQVQGTHPGRCADGSFPVWGAVSFFYRFRNSEFLLTGPNLIRM